jgi:hypothetical protein
MQWLRMNTLPDAWPKVDVKPPCRPHKKEKGTLSNVAGAITVPQQKA